MKIYRFDLDTTNYTSQDSERSASCAEAVRDSFFVIEEQLECPALVCARLLSAGLGEISVWYVSAFSYLSARRTSE